MRGALNAERAYVLPSRPLYPPPRPRPGAGWRERPGTYLFWRKFSHLSSKGSTWGKATVSGRSA